MAPLLILVVVTLAVRLSGRRPVPVALRFGLAAMFVATGLAHFIGMRDELVAMVPPSLPEPGLLVSLTGVLELLGAAGLALRRTTLASAVALMLLLVALFPANVYAATHGRVADWTDELLPRTILQIVFLAATAVVVRHYASRRTLHHEPRLTTPAAVPSPRTRATDSRSPRLRRTPPA